jgi:hypothetical protein
MAGKTFSNPPQIITIAPLSGGIATSGTGSFDPIGISQTPFVSFMITKLTDKNVLNSISLFKTNSTVDWDGRPGTNPPSGSANDYLWCNDPNWSVSPGGLASGYGGVSGSVFSGSVAAAPFTTGSISGSVVFEGQINSRYVRIDLRSTSGGRFMLTAVGKE